MIKNYIVQHRYLSLAVFKYISLSYKSNRFFLGKYRLSFFQASMSCWLLHIDPVTNLGEKL